MRVLVYAPAGGFPVRVLKADTGRDVVEALQYLSMLSDESEARYATTQPPFDGIGYYGLVPGWESGVYAWAQKYLPENSQIQFAEVLAHNG